MGNGHSVTGYDVVTTDPHWLAKHYGRIGNVLAQGFHVFGRRSGFNSTTVLQDIGEFLGTAADTFPVLTGAENLEVVSSSANDAAAGTGTRTIRVRYLDTSGNMQTSAPITMNGVTPVAVPFKALFIYWTSAITGGSLETSAGNILLRVAGGGATHDLITAGGNRSMNAKFMVPNGYHAHVHRWDVCTVGTATQDVRIRMTSLEDGTLCDRYIFKGNLAAGSVPSFMFQEIPWLTCPSMGRIKISTLSSSAGAANRVDTTFSVLLVQNM